MNLEIDTREIIHALSSSLDLVGVDEVYHGSRVAFMALQCGQTLGLDSDLLDTLHHAALLHDCGVSSTTVHRNLVTELDWSHSQLHCERGSNLLRTTNLLADLAPIVRYHHTHWDELPKDIDQHTSILCNIIYLTDRVDALMAQHFENDYLLAGNSTKKIIKKYSGTFFSPEVVDAYLEVSASEFFWMALDPRHLTTYLQKMIASPQKQMINGDTVLEIAAIFADIVDAKSPFTVQHSLGVAMLARYLGTLCDLDNDTLLQLQVSGLLHDLGKLNIPDEILEKPGPLTGREQLIMKQHSFESYQILNKINGFESIAQWSAFHHETLCGQGYPFHIHNFGLCLEARIIAVADIFQALAQDRPYRNALDPNKILAIMNKMAQENKIDPGLVVLIQDNLEECLLQAQCG
ncbi:MAG: HD domain-containing protein [Desulfobulbaceae bacterium]|nr:HD domain-containing protein [Desulfobulbaceae bacterium]